MTNCENCNEKCPQAEMAHEIALGRMYATQELVRLVKQIESGKLVEAAQQWISVKDRLPDPGQEVLIYERYKDEPEYIISVTSYRPDIYQPIWKFVTHWMPIPEPPKTE